MQKKLYRDTEEGALAGVCAGLGDYLQIDKTWVRLIFIFSVLMAPFLGIGLLGPLVYVILWIMVPVKSRFNKRSSFYNESTGPVRSGSPQSASPFDVDYRVHPVTEEQDVRDDTVSVQPNEASPSRGASDRRVVGLILLGLGMVFLLQQLGIWDWQKVTRYWPVLLMVAGTAMVISGLSSNEKTQHPSKQ